MTNIKSERARLGLTQEALAIRLEVSPFTISNWETESTPIPSTKAVEMSQLFGCSVDYLFGLSNDRLTTSDNRKTIV